MGTSAMAGFCEDLQSFEAQSVPMSLALPESGALTTCSRSLQLSGGTQVHCGWAFPYRAEEARSAFQAVLEAVSQCPGGALLGKEDPDVNHPDSYDLQTFRLSAFEIGVSLKDKGALGETYVFVRISPLN